MKKVKCSECKYIRYSRCGYVDYNPYTSMARRWGNISLNNEGTCPNYKGKTHILLFNLLKQLWPSDEESKVIVHTEEEIDRFVE